VLVVITVDVARITEDMLLLLRSRITDTLLCIPRITHHITLPRAIVLLWFTVATATVATAAAFVVGVELNRVSAGLFPLWLKRTDLWAYRLVVKDRGLSSP
jgi:hypothetical protein